MTHTYQLTGMTCGNCEAKVKSSLLALPNITSVEVAKETNSAIISMDKHIALADLQTALGGAASKYKIAAKPLVGISNPDEKEQWISNSQNTRSWFETYKPILLIFGYITLVSGLINFYLFPLRGLGGFMGHFMAGFFLVFSFFKLLNLKGFAESYVMYDVLAKQIPAWATIYVFVELGLGIAFLIGYNPFITNWVALIVMSISIVGVLKSVLNKQKIQCACLGAVFNLPMSTVTIIEDALMIGMSGTMLLMM